MINIKTKIIKAPYICTVPSGGLHAVQCFPDAIAFFSKGKKYGYSKRARTLIAPYESSFKEALEAQEMYFKHQDFIQK